LRHRGLEVQRHHHHDQDLLSPVRLRDHRAHAHQQSRRTPVTPENQHRRSREHFALPQTGVPGQARRRSSRQAARQEEERRQEGLGERARRKAQLGEEEERCKKQQKRPCRPVRPPQLQAIAQGHELRDHRPQVAAGAL